MFTIADNKDAGMTDIFSNSKCKYDVLATCWKLFEFFSWPLHAYHSPTCERVPEKERDTPRHKTDTCRKKFLRN